jgi:hypothetical protein
MAVKLTTISPLTLSLANTPTAVSANAIAVTSLTIQSDKNNTASIFVGDASVDVNSGMEIVPGETAEITADNVGRGGSEEFLISEVYIVTATTGQIVRAAAFTRRV